MDNNGRIDIRGTVFDTYKVTERGEQDDFNDEAVRGVMSRNELNDIFFSQENIDALQQGIRYIVYQKSCQKHIIDRQSDDELKIIMRSIYLQHAKNQPTLVLEQVRELNGFVLDFCVPRILNEISIQMDYRRHASTLPVPLARSLNTSVAGTKTLEMKDW